VGPTGRVVAFEASPSTAVLTGAILKNLGVEFHACALGATKGIATLELFVDSKGNPIRGHTRIAGAGDGREFGMTESTEVLRLDKVVRERQSPVRFIKIDVEGHELAVLAGAEKVILSDHPVLLIEANSAKHLDDLLGLLIPLGYSSWFCSDTGEITATSRFLPCHNNYIFIAQQGTEK
jgi:FkbM family methyltransferase